MKLSIILGAVATVGLGTAMAIPRLTHGEEQKENDSRCLSQYKAALVAGVQLPPINDTDVIYKTLYGGRGEGCFANNETITWNPSNNLLTLYKK